MENATLTTGATVTGTDADGNAQTGTITRVASHAAARCRVNLPDGTNVTLTGCVSDADVADADAARDAAMATDAVTDAVADAVATADPDAPVRERQVIRNADGSQVIVYTNGRTLFIAAKTDLTHQGVTVAESFGRRGAQGAVWHDADGSDHLCIGIICRGQVMVGATSFPTVSGSASRNADGMPDRQSECRGCASARRAGSGLARRNGGTLTGADARAVMPNTPGQTVA